jgi:hypothetical protein
VLPRYPRIRNLELERPADPDRASPVAATDLDAIDVGEDVPR